MKTIKSIKTIENVLAASGAINKVGGQYLLCSARDQTREISEDVAEVLLYSHRLVVVGVGCTGWWRALRPDLVAAKGP